MSKKAVSSENHISPFEQIKQTDDDGAEFWSSRDFAEVLEYDNYRNFKRVIEKAKLACFNSSHNIEDHFVDADDMIEIGKGGKRSVKTVLMSRYACYLVTISSRIVLVRAENVFSSISVSAKTCASSIISKPGNWQLIQSPPLLKTQTSQKFLNIQGSLTGFI